MSSIMRRRRGLKSAISILLSEGVGSNTHILSARRRSTPPCPLRRGSGFVQSSFDDQSPKSAKVVLGRVNLRQCPLSSDIDRLCATAAKVAMGQQYKCQ